MNLTDLAHEYRLSAAALSRRINSLKDKLNTEDMCPMSQMRLRRRIDTLSSMHRDTARTAIYLENYYEKNKPVRH